MESTSFTNKLKLFFSIVVDTIKDFVLKVYNGIPQVSAESLGLLGICMLHATTLPSLLALITGTSDSLPPIDIVIFVWGGLMLLFVRSFILKDMVGIFTNFAGFFAQACILGFLIFK